MNLVLVIPPASMRPKSSKSSRYLLWWIRWGESMDGPTDGDETKQWPSSDLIRTISSSNLSKMNSLIGCSDSLLNDEPISWSLCNCWQSRLKSSFCRRLSDSLVRQKFQIKDSISKKVGACLRSKTSAARNSFFFLDRRPLPLMGVWVAVECMLPSTSSSLPSKSRIGCSSGNGSNIRFWLKNRLFSILLLALLLITMLLAFRPPLLHSTFSVGLIATD